MENQRTIKTILSLETGLQIEVDDLLKDSVSREAEIFQLRTRIEVGLQTKKIEFVCIYCKQPVAIRGRKSFNDQSKHFYFTHPYKSQECIIKTEHRLSEEQVRCIKYNGEKESKLHEKLKNLIGSYLEKDEQSPLIRIDKVFKEKSISKEWRKPDVLAIFPKMKIAFELQLSTTFLSVIVGRTIFYKNRGIFLIWVFPNFSLQQDFQKFTQKDVYYNNNFNVYVFDEDAQLRSKDAQELVLKCFFIEFTRDGEELIDKWSFEFIRIRDLNFSIEETNVCFYNSVKEKERLQEEIEAMKKERLEREEHQQIQKEVNLVANYIREFYKSDCEPPYYSKEALFARINSKAHIDALNSILKFTNENSGTITKLFIKHDKPKFLEMLCKQECILIDTSILKTEGETILQKLFTIHYEDTFKKYIELLFLRGYKLSEFDKDWLASIFNLNSSYRTDQEREYIKRWALVCFISEPSIDRSEYHFILENKILLAIASARYSKVIGFGYINLKQVTDYVFENKKEFLKVFIESLRIYGHYETLFEKDKKGTLKKKLTTYYAHKPEQDISYNQIIYKIFPEIKV